MAVPQWEEESLVEFIVWKIVAAPKGATYRPRPRRIADASDARGIYFITENGLISPKGWVNVSNATRYTAFLSMN